MMIHDLDFDYSPTDKQHLRDVPEYMAVDHTKMSASLSSVPQLADIPYPVQMEPNLVVEFYSRN